MKTEFELSEEQKLAIEKRKAFLKQQAEDAATAKRERAKRNVMDVKATFSRLVASGRVKPSSIIGRNEQQIRKFVRTACIAYNIKAISVAGTDVDMNPIVGRVRIR